MENKIIILFLIVLVSCSFLIGCTKRDFKGYKIDYILEKERLSITAKQECRGHGQEYLLHYTNNLENWIAVCYQQSPFKPYEYAIS